MPRLLPNQTPHGGVPDYAAEANRVSVITHELGHACEFKSLDIGGTLLWVIDASSNVAELEWRYRNSGDTPIPLRRGTMIRGVAFRNPIICHENLPGEWIKILYADESLGNIQVENYAAAFTDVNLSRPTNFVSVADVSYTALNDTLVLAANSKRYEAFISNNTGDYLRIKDSASGAEGFRIAPNDTAIVETTDDIYVYGAGSGDVYVSYSEFAA